jgi:nucleoside phosphorylase
MFSKSWRVDVGIVTVIPEELEWTRKALDISVDSRRKVRSGRVYYFGEIAAPFAHGSYRVALVCVGEGGTAECASTTTALILQCRPRIVILVGIAAGMRKSTKIGSVVISERIWGYEKEVLATGRKKRLKRVPRPNVQSLPFGIQQDITHYFSTTGLCNRISARFQEIGGVYPKPAKGEKARVVNFPDVQWATIASGNKLLRHPGLLYRLQSAGHGRIKIGEMEADGLATACHQESVDWLVVRGISDFGDKSKGDNYHDLAAQMAAVTTRDFVERGLEVSGRSSRPVRRKAILPPIPTIAQVREAVSSLPSQEPSKSAAGPVAAKMIELSSPFAGEVFRVVRQRIFSTTRPMDGAPFPSRFSSHGGFLYFAFSAEHALGELMVDSSKFQSAKASGLIVAEFRVRLSFVLNLTERTVQKALSIDPGALVSQDTSYARSIADAARLAGCEALIFNSIRGHPSLVVFDRISPKSEVRFVEPIAK